MANRTAPDMNNFKILSKNSLISLFSFGKTISLSNSKTACQSCHMFVLDFYAIQAHNPFILIFISCCRNVIILNSVKVIVFIYRQNHVRINIFNFILNQPEFPIDSFFNSQFLISFFKVGNDFFKKKIRLNDQLIQL